MPVTMSTITSRTSIAGANPTVTVKVGGGMLPLNQKILARLDQRNVAAHPWHDLEIGELQASETRFYLLICKVLVMDIKTFGSYPFTPSSDSWNLCRRFHTHQINKMQYEHSNVGRIRIYFWICYFACFDFFVGVPHRPGSTADFQLCKSSTRNIQIQSKLLFCQKACSWIL